MVGNKNDWPGWKFLSILDLPSAKVEPQRSATIILEGVINEFPHLPEFSRGLSSTNSGRLRFIFKIFTL